MAQFRGKYRVKSSRFASWDYTSAAWYFVTICTRDHACDFGAIDGGDLCYSPIGDIVAAEWVRTRELRANVELDEWIVMPNHIHGIVVIETNGERAMTLTASGDNGPQATETFQRNVSTGRWPDRKDVANPEIGPYADDGKKIRLLAGSLGAIIGQFKGASTKRIWAAGFSNFAWQSRFYDHVIRDEYSLEKIRIYIRNNPLRWEKDADNPSRPPSAGQPKTSY